MDLGPIVRGDKSILDHDLTHATSGLPLYPAFDTGWRDGDLVIAPERVTITRHSGNSHSGWSFYATGDSKLRYYVTHLRWNRVPIGRTVEKGERLGDVGNFVGARVPHAHVGVNVERLLGTGVELKHNTTYTHGQPTLREQLLQEEDDLDWLPAWLEWYLGDRDPAKRPEAPARIPAVAWNVVKVVADDRKARPGDGAELQAKIDAAIRALS